MYYKVRIKKLPNKALGGAETGKQNSDMSLSIQPTAMGGADIDQYIGKPNPEIKDTLSPVPRDKANLEAEKGETAYGDINGDGFAEHYKIAGKRHYQGGTPLNLPDNTFIFSDTRSMKISDPSILKMFNRPEKKGGYTPAELAKQYDVNKYRKILQDPNSDAVDRKTAETMIRNYSIKLGALALAQESKKGFPQGIPVVAQPYMESMGLREEDIIPQKKQPQQEAPQQEMAQEEMPQEAMMEQMPMMPQAQNGMFINPYEMSPDVLEQMNLDYANRTKGIQLPEEYYNNVQQPWMDFQSPLVSYPSYNDGKMTKKYYPYSPQQSMDVYAEGGLYKAQKGTATPPYSMEEAYTPKGVVRLNKYRQMYGLPQLKGSVTKADIKKAVTELQGKIVETNPDLVVDYMSRTSHQPNKKLLAKIPSGYDPTTEGVAQAYKDGKLSADDIKDAYKDDQWWYRALETKRVKLTPKEYEEKMKQEGAIKQGDITYFQDDPDSPDVYTEYYTDDAEPDVIDVPEEVVDEEERPPIEDIDFMQQQAVAPEWTTPDLLNYYGTLKDKYSVNKYFPWAPRFEPEVPEAVYYDPTRELAAQSEQANILTQGLGQFVGPQALSARAASIQGQGAQQAADTLARYNNLNVGAANQFEQNAANIRNQAQLQNQGIAKQLYDQTVMTNQQYDNAMRMADQAKRAAFATGWKNASDLAMVNATSDQYDVDPRSGQVIFTGGKEATPTLAKDFNYWLNEYKSQGMSDKDAIAAAKIAIGQGSGYSGPDLDAIGQTAQQGGYVLGTNVFPFMFY